MSETYKGVLVKRLDLPILSGYAEGYYKGGVIYIKKALSEDKREVILEHEYQHYRFAKKHRWLKYLVDDYVVLGLLALITASWLIGFGYTFLLLALLMPYFSHETAIHLTEKKPRKQVIVYSVFLYLIILVVLLGIVSML